MAHGDMLAAIRKTSTLLEQEVEGDQFVRLKVRALERTFGNLKRRAPEGVVFEVLEPAIEPFTSSEAGD
jgi:hypothetical protein